MKLKEAFPSLDGATTIINGTLDEITNSNKPIFVHFWSISCQLCKNAMPKVNEFKEQYKDEMLTVSVHIPRCEEDLDISCVRETMEKLKISHITLIDNEHQLKDAFDNKCVPAYYLFDQNRMLRHYQAGGSSMTMLARRLQRIYSESIVEE